LAELAPVVLREVGYFEAVAKLSCSIFEPLMIHPLALSSSVEILSPSFQINELERALKREATDDRNRASIQSLRPDSLGNDPQPSTAIFKGCEKSKSGNLRVRSQNNRNPQIRNPPSQEIDAAKTWTSHFAQMTEEQVIRRGRQLQQDCVQVTRKLICHHSYRWIRLHSILAQK
jgi:hypothetical protein